MSFRTTGINPEDIKSELRKKYGTLRSISLQLGLSKNAVSAVLCDLCHSIKTERLVAELLNKTPSEVWGNERFDRNGDAKPRTKNNRQIIAVPARLRKEGMAACF